MAFPELEDIKFPAENLHTMLLSAFQRESWQELPVIELIAESIVFPTLIEADESKRPKCFPRT
jgi:hypothetical protein